MTPAKYTPEDIIRDGDRFLMIVSPEEALRVCRDTQIWFYGYHTQSWRKDSPPEKMREVFDGIEWNIWSKYTFAVEVDPPKSEYECESD